MSYSDSCGRHPVLMRCDLRKLLSFYDLKSNWKDPQEEDATSPISAITGLIGEDLVIGALRHYFRHRKQENLTFEPRCKQPGISGYRLDGWVLSSLFAYQTEIKNWCASALGGKSVAEDRLLEVAKDNLQHYLGGGENPRSVWKVLAKMEAAPVADRPIRPLLAFWSPVATGEQEADTLPPAFFDCEIAPYRDVIDGAGISTAFTTVSIFSASLHLRSLSDDVVELEMPRASRRLRKIEEMLRGWSVH